MGALPELAPMGESHLLRSSSVVQKISYAPHRITYKTFDPEGTQVMRLNFKPTRVTAGETILQERKDLLQAGYTIEPAQGDFIVRLHHAAATDVVVEGK
jgi:hypothetical protein